MKLYLIFIKFTHLSQKSSPANYTQAIVTIHNNFKHDTVLFIKGFFCDEVTIF